MAMNVGWSGIGQHSNITLKSALVAADKGKMVKISTNDTGALCAAEDIPIGKIVQVDDDGGLSVQVKGYITQTYTGGAPALGWTELVGDNAGGVKSPAMAGTGKKYFIVNVDAGTTKVTFDLG